MASVFTMIIKGEIPGHFVWKDDRAVAFLSINPLNEGHTLVVPRAEIDHWIDLDDDLASHLMGVARAIGTAQQDVFQPRRIGLMIAGFEVPHTHLHVVPINGLHDMDFGNAADSVDPEELKRAAERLRAALRALGYSEVSD
ncbi:MAG: HIT family protein [Chloroflexota bacterium]